MQVPTTISTVDLFVHEKKGEQIGEQHFYMQSAVLLPIFHIPTEHHDKAHNAVDAADPLWESVD